MYFTYILESSNKPGGRYIDHTSNPDRRLKEHNTGKCGQTAGLKPWKLKLCSALCPAFNFRKPCTHWWSTWTTLNKTFRAMSLGQTNL
jgi:hypothetical protein